MSKTKREKVFISSFPNTVMDLEAKFQATVLPGTTTPVMQPIMRKIQFSTGRFATSDPELIEFLEESRPFADGTIRRLDDIPNPEDEKVKEKTGAEVNAQTVREANVITGQNNGVIGGLIDTLNTLNDRGTIAQRMARLALESEGLSDEERSAVNAEAAALIEKHEEQEAFRLASITATEAADAQPPPDTSEDEADGEPAGDEDNPFAEITSLEDAANILKQEPYGYLDEDLQTSKGAWSITKIKVAASECEISFPNISTGP